MKTSTAHKNMILGKNGTDTGANGWRGIYHLSIIDLYDGSQPASANDAPNGTLLGSITVGGATYNESTGENGLQFDAPANGVIGKPSAASWAYTGIAAGTIRYGRLRTFGDSKAADSSALYPRVDLSAGVSSGEIRLSVVDVVIGTPGLVQSCAITQA
jgi:hypothetical protein